MPKVLLITLTFKIINNQGLQYKALLSQNRRMEVTITKLISWSI